MTIDIPNTGPTPNILEGDELRNFITPTIEQLIKTAKACNLEDLANYLENSANQDVIDEAIKNSVGVEIKNADNWPTSYLIISVIGNTLTALQLGVIESGKQI